MPIADTLLPGPPSTLIAWVGDAPSFDDARTLQAWSGPAGRLLRTHYAGPLAATHLLTTLITEPAPAKLPASAYRAAYTPLVTRLTAAGSDATRRILVLLGSEPCAFVHALDRTFPRGIQKALSHQLRTLRIHDQDWTVLFTYNPGHVLRQPNLARAADNHHRLLRLHLSDRLATRTAPLILPTRGPGPNDPRTIVLDIETYGAVKRFGSGAPSPAQKDTAHNGRFHPARSVYEDAPQRLVVTASITLPATDTRDPQPLILWPGTFPHSRETLMRLKPGPTFTFDLERSDHRAHLAAWLRHADTLIGHNLLFDLQYLRFSEPLCRAALAPFSKHLVDSGILAYLQDETRPEKSLKDLGPLLGLYLYEDSLRHTTFDNPQDKRLHRYNAEDTHNTLLLTSGMAALIDDEWASIDKAMHECLAFYSRTMWSVLPMLERGVPFSIPALLALETQTRATIAQSRAICAAADLSISGTGSQTSSRAYIRAICDRVPGLITHELFQLTETTRELSTSALNIKLCKYHLPPDDPAHPVLDAWLTEKSASKLLTTYIIPLLYATNNTLKYLDKDVTQLNRTSALIPEIKPCSFSPPSSPLASSAPSPASPNAADHLLCPTAVGVAYPGVYITPSSTTDSSDDEGGTEQMRMVFKGPSLQTFPPEIQACQTTRPTFDYLWSMDLAQIEMRVPALLSGEPKLMAAFKSGLDLHTDKAISIFGRPFLEERLGLGSGAVIDKNTPGFNDYRQVGKTDNFASQFWATAPTMQRTVFRDQMIYVPIEFFKKAVDSRPTSMPIFHAWQLATVKEGTDKSYLHLPLLGLSRHFVGGAEFHLNKLLNLKVQALAAAVLLDIQHRMAYRLADDRRWTLYLNVYDALKGECTSAGRDLVRGHLADSVHECTTVGVWGQYQRLYNRTVPLDYDLEFKVPKPATLPS